MESSLSFSPFGTSSSTTVVTSEVHFGCLPHVSGSYISRFTFNNSRPCIPCVANSESREENDADSTVADGDHFFDEDGDLILARRIRITNERFCLNVKHNISSSIEFVGLQLWHAELVLADFVLHKISTSEEFDGVVSLELGAGIGLAGMLLARVARTVFLTDGCREALENCDMNVHLNCYGGRGASSYSIYVRELDWKKPWPPINIGVDKRYSWTSKEVEVVKDALVVLAADVIYNDDLTDALFDILEKLMSHGVEKVLYLALEKRYNFSLDDFDVVANGYSRFLAHLSVLEGEEFGSSKVSGFRGRLVDISNIPVYINEYERGNDVEIWEIRFNSS